MTDANTRPPQQQTVPSAKHAVVRGHVGVAVNTRFATQSSVETCFDAAKRIDSAPVPHLQCAELGLAD